MPLFDDAPSIATGETRELSYDVLSSFVFTYYNWIILTISLFVIIYGVRWYYTTRMKK